MTAPILLAGLGGLLSERAGVLNIGLEGLILWSAFFAYAVAASVAVLGAPALGIALAVPAGALAGALLAALFAYVVLKLEANVFVAGLAINLLASGLVPFFSIAFYGGKGVVREELIGEVPRLFDLPGLPFFGELLFGHSVFVYLSWVAAAAVLVGLYRSYVGLHLRTAGSRPELLKLRGRSPSRYQALALVLSGAFAGLAGANLSLRLGAYVPGISGGRGWIALVTVYLGYRNPIGLAIAAFVFGLSESLAVAAQGTLNIPNTLLLGLPYAITVLALLSYAALRKRRASRA
jgi:simple sugar transport system permease protein